mgnify:CR=1 FL=1
MSLSVAIDPGAQAGTALPRRRLRILYADDLPQLRDVAQISLERDGHVIECAADGCEAWKRVQEHADAYDVVITDHHMPNMNGLEFVTKLRELPYHGAILVLTSELNPFVASAYRKLRVDAIIYKPVLPRTLRQLVADHAAA